MGKHCKIVDKAIAYCSGFILQVPWDARYIWTGAGWSVESKKKQLCTLINFKLKNYFITGIITYSLLKHFH